MGVINTIDNTGATPTLMGINRVVPTSELDVVGTVTIEPGSNIDPFAMLIGEAAAADLTRNIVDNGDVTSSAIAGWVKVEVRDDGNQIADQEYFIPVYTISAGAPSRILQENLDVILQENLDDILQE